MPGPFDPEGLHSSGTALVHSEAMGEIDDFVLRPVNDQHRRRHLRYLVNAANRKAGRKRERSSLVLLTDNITIWLNQARRQGRSHCAPNPTHFSSNSFFKNTFRFGIISDLQNRAEIIKTSYTPLASCPRVATVHYHVTFVETKKAMPAHWELHSGLHVDVIGFFTNVLFCSRTQMRIPHCIRPLCFG